MKADPQKLRLAMAGACLTTKELVSMTGMPRPSVNNVICGRSVKPATLGRVARALGVPVTDILKED